MRYSFYLNITSGKDINKKLFITLYGNVFCFLHLFFLQKHVVHKEKTKKEPQKNATLFL